jgi:hypothetical protein
MRPFRYEGKADGETGSGVVCTMHISFLWQEFHCRRLKQLMWRDKQRQLLLFSSSNLPSM